MNRIQTTAVLATIALSFAVSGCADPKPVTDTSTPTAPFTSLPAIEGGLVFDSVLHRSDLEMFPNFADLNSDSKPDLILGTVRNVSIQLNESAKDRLSFAAAENPKRSHSDFDIPWG